MTPNSISRAACLAEITSNPKSFFNCPDMHGGSQGMRPSGRGSQLSAFAKATADKSVICQGEKGEERRTENGERRMENGE